MTVLIEANVVLDLFLGREPDHTRAVRFFSYIDSPESGVHAFVTPTILAQVAHELARRKSHAYALHKLRALRCVVSVVSVDEAIVDETLARPLTGFGTGLLYQCARREKHAIITTKRRRFPARATEILTPSEFVRFHRAMKES